MFDRICQMAPIVGAVASCQLFAQNWQASSYDQVQQQQQLGGCH